jgi:hypothetical protein
MMLESELAELEKAIRVVELTNLVRGKEPDSVPVELVRLTQYEEPDCYSVVVVDLVSTAVVRSDSGPESLRKLSSHFLLEYLLVRQPLSPAPAHAL